jgi:hypothetical protein
VWKEDDSSVADNKRIISMLNELKYKLKEDIKSLVNTKKTLKKILEDTKTNK